MAGNKIYVQGSYIDIHDNQNVYLSVDKAQVSVADGMRKDDASLPENEENLTGVLASDEAMRYWKRLQQKGFVDECCQLKPETTRKQAMYIAEVFAERLGIGSKWKTFERLWGISNLAQEKWDFQQTGTLPSRSKEIDRIFED